MLEKSFLKGRSIINPRTGLTCLLALVLLASAACTLPNPRGTPAANTTSIPLDVILTQTVSAILQITPTQPPQTTAEGNGLPSTSTSPPPTATLTPIPPTATVTPTQAPTQTPGNCTDKAKLTGETVPDGTSFTPKQTFTKVWKLQNAGTCTWTKDYAVQFVDGEQMGASSPQPINQTVAPNSTVAISVTMTAPDKAGSYQGNWKLRNPGGSAFGLGTNADKSFFVQIKVVEAMTGSDLGAPTWEDKFGSDTGWGLGSYNDADFEIDKGELVMTALKPDGDLWRVSSQPALSNFFLEAHFKTGKECSGKDSYGVVVRTTDQGDDVFDTAYVFGFSCDGNYRFYRMDNGTYAPLITWTPADNINKGPDKGNTMGILVQGSTFKLYANGKLLNEVTDDTHDKGKIGLFVRSANTTGFITYVTDIAYWEK
ncbi:MAG: NBR1-Ig-like domain-containing protein [Omnitrophica WOR_2 bacterium]